MWFVFHAAKSGGNMIVGRVVERVGAGDLIVAGWLAYVLVYLGFGLASEPWHAWALFMAYAVFYSLTEPPEKTLGGCSWSLASTPAWPMAGTTSRSAWPPCRPACCSDFSTRNSVALPAFATGAALALAAAILLLGVRQPGAGTETAG